MRSLWRYGLVAAVCAVVFRAWLDPQHVASWLLLSVFCS
jgi:hypothetical protein